MEDQLLVAMTYYLWLINQQTKTMMDKWPYYDLLKYLWTVTDIYDTYLTQFNLLKQILLSLNFKLHSQGQLSIIYYSSQSTSVSNWAIVSYCSNGMPQMRLTNVIKVISVYFWLFTFMWLQSWTNYFRASYKELPIHFQSIPG